MLNIDILYWLSRNAYCSYNKYERAPYTKGMDLECVLSTFNQIYTSLAERENILVVDDELEDFTSAFYHKTTSLQSVNSAKLITSNGKNGI